MSEPDIEDLEDGETLLDECACGHVRDEHGGDPKYSGSTACNVDDCDCICFEGMA